ncbi:DUF302 domain-containing protein [Psychroflexus sediminis]|uniref:Uncharacterized conserved protein, DUF302 family n=1 Tax=Psychroflexus sediminis TaxID=470826 RepID=A0A1G7WW13_9FLAO|nr:DUF302 domain-containing protein [Psychroflexus sediminis]SDG76094.1 Uncharacterized conserved protein, DUF302 family [Psychroflexus sediminis]
MHYRFKITLPVILSFLIISCIDNSEKKDISKIDKQISPGLIFTKTDDLKEAAKDFKSYVNTDSTLEISTDIDHAQNAKKIDLELDFNQVFFIDNPRYSVPIIEVNPLTALEFPVRIGFYNVDGEKFVVARSEDYFLKRYNLPKSAALRSIGALSETFLKQSSKAAYTQTSPIDSLDYNGIVTLKSSKDYKQTVTSIGKMIENNDDLTLFESKDFSKDAEKISIKLKPLHLFVFGNPKVGTQLMKQNPNFSIDLPLKVLVQGNEDEQVSVHFHDVSFTAKLHEEEFENDLPAKITKNLKEMLTEAISDEK